MFGLVLNAKLRLHELDDVEAVCVNVLRRANLDLDYHDREDCLAFLVETSWELSLTYERGDFPSRFGIYLVRILRQRLNDWQRSRNGRTKWAFHDRVYERTLPSFVPLEDRLDGPDHSFMDHVDGGGLSDLLGLQRKRGSKGDGGNEEAGSPAARRVA